MKRQSLLTNLFLAIIISCAVGCKEKANSKNQDKTPEVFKAKAMTVKSSKGDVDIQYTQHSPGTHALVFVHGWSCDQSYWENQLEYFSKEYQVVTLDLGGHGASGSNRTDWTVAAYGGDVLDVINALTFEKLSLVGHSMGAMVVIDAAANLEETANALVCVDYLKTPLAHLPPEVTEQMVAPFRADFVNATKGFVSTMFLPTSDTTLVSKTASDLSSAPADIAIPSMKGLFERDFTSDFTKLSNENVNRHIINSNAVPMDEAHYDSLGFKTHIIKESGHFIMIEKADEFNTLLKDIIQ